MWLNVLQAKSTSQQCWSAVFPTVLGVASPMLLAGLPCDLYKQLLACSSSQCVCQSLVACLPIFVQCFFPALPPSLVQGQVREKNILVGKDSTDQFIVTVPGGAPRRVAMVYTSFLVLEHCPAPPTLQAPVPKLICW